MQARQVVSGQLCSFFFFFLIFQDSSDRIVPRIGYDGERIKIKKDKDPEKKKKKRKLEGGDPLKPKKVKVITVGLDGEKLKKKKMKLMKPKIKKEFDENGFGKLGRSFTNNENLRLVQIESIYRRQNKCE